jgi:hypothetical protein
LAISAAVSPILPRAWIRVEASLFSKKASPAANADLRLSLVSGQKLASSPWVLSPPDAAVESPLAFDFRIA